MKTDDLIASLAAVTRPTPPSTVLRRFALPLGAGVACAVALSALWLGLAPWPQSAGAGGFWLKFSYSLALGGIGLMLALRLARPGALVGRGAMLAMGGLVAAVALAGAMQLLLVPAHDRLDLWLGRTWSRCPFLITAVAAPVYGAAAVALRQLAPTRPATAGAAAGLLAGGFGAAAYALHCPEYAPAFIATWYTAGIALSTALGALVGARLLRW